MTTNAETLYPPSTHTSTMDASSDFSKSAEPSVFEKREPTETGMMSSETQSAKGSTKAREDIDNGDSVQNEKAVAETAVDTPPPEEEHEYPTSWKLVLITIALCLSVLCMALDNTIIATAIPKITDQFHALDDVGWYGSAYLLTTCATQLIYGKIYTFYSIKWTYLVALAIFEIGSFICGISPNSDALIIGRAIAGLGAAGIFSGAILIVAHTVPLRQRPSYTGLIGAMYGIASIAGPLMGGAFTDRLTWRWCFYINLPFGAVTAIFIVFFFTSPTKKKTKTSFKNQLKQIDILGTFLFVPAVVSLLLALQWGGSKYDWNNAKIIALFVVFGVLIIAFLVVQVWQQENATVPPRVFKNRNVWGSSFFGACLGAAFFIMVFYIPIWFQAIKGVSAVKSGIMNLPMILGLVIVSMVAGGAVTAVGYYTPFMLVSSVFMAIGAGLLTTFETDTAHDKWIGYQFVFGAGVGFGMQQTLIAVQTALPGPDIAIGTAIMMFSQTLGGALFISVGQNVFQNQLIKHLAKEVPDFNPGIVLITGATELKNAIPTQFLSQVLVAYNAALTETWYVSVATAALSILGAVFVEWKSVKGKKIEAVGGA